MLAHLKEILLYPKQADLPIAISMLGGSGNRTTEAVAATVAALRRWVLVVVGPAAEKTWRHEEVCGAEDGTSHAAACCYLCLEYAVYGSCAHAYVGLRLKGILREDRMAHFFLCC